MQALASKAERLDRIAQRNLKRKLIIGNVDGESQVGEPERRDHSIVISSAVCTNRLTWLAKEGDVLLLPSPLSTDFIDYVTDLMNVEKGSVRQVVPEGATLENVCTLTYEVLAAPSLVQTLGRLLEDSEQEWEVLPYYFDRAVSYLSKQLPVTVNAGALEFFLQGGAEMLNSKIEFRRIGGANDIPMPEGINCYSRPELERALHELLDLTGSVILKQDYSAGGDGNIVLTLDPNRTESTGATQTIQLRSKQELSQHAEELWERLTGARNTALVVESYRDTTAVFYSELEIKAGALRPYLLNFGDMRMEPVWNGFQIPPISLSPYAIGEFVSCSMQLADVARQRGFVGKINVDGMLTANGEVLFSEVNGRLGGCTHIHVVAEHLYGANYGDHYTLLTRNKIPVGCSFLELLELLEEHNLRVKGPHETGVLILTEDLERTGTVEYMVVGNGAKHALELEQQALELFEGSVAR